MIDKYFLKYNNICKTITIKELELSTLLLTNKDVNAISYSEKTSGSKRIAGIDSKVIMIEKLNEDINNLYLKKEKRKNVHLKDFKKLSKADYVIILTSYYLDKASLKDISVKLDKSIGYIKKLKSDALKELINIIKNT